MVRWYQPSEFDVPRACPECGSPLEWFPHKGCNHRVKFYSLCCPRCGRPSEWQRSPGGLIRPVRRRKTCRNCDHYRRTRNGLWKKPDWQTGAGRCIHPQSIQCKYIRNLVPRRDLFRPKSVNGPRLDEGGTIQI